MVAGFTRHTDSPARDAIGTGSSQIGAFPA